MSKAWLRGVAVGITAIAVLLGSTPRVLGQAGEPSHSSLPLSLLSAPPLATRHFQIVSSGHAALPSGTSTAAGDPSAGEVLKEIDDPQNGNRWLLTSDPSHPGGPGLLRLAGTVTVTARRAAPALAQRPDSGQEISPQTAPHSEPALPDAVLPVIRSGDRIVLEQHTSVIDARLEAVAIGPASAGTAFSARLLMGGGMVHAIAVSSGHAVLAEEMQSEEMHR
jgi:hypothetical protein